MISASPLDGLERPNEPADRERVLTDQELVAIYRSAQMVGYPFGHIILICIHTSMRRGEVGALKRSYVTPENITLPAEVRSKKKGGELVLPNLINAELSSIPIIGNTTIISRPRREGRSARGGRIRFASIS
jgi:integrase